jgi:nucleotide-binding universal stress UspA family protein
MYQRIIVAIDGSDTAHRALDAAIGLAQCANATLQPLYVVDVPLLYYDVPIYSASMARDVMFEEGARIATEAVDLMKKKGVKGAHRVVQTEGAQDVARCIISAASEFGADVLVLGTHGRGGFERLMLGSVADRTLRLTTCPILLVPSKEAGSAT